MILRLDEIRDITFISKYILYSTCSTTETISYQEQNKTKITLGQDLVRFTMLSSMPSSSMDESYVHITNPYFTAENRNLQEVFRLRFPKSK